MKGVIYKWTCNVNGKSYIGQTVNEKRREKDFLTEGSYAGKKIDNARKKYGLSEGTWTKEVLKRLWCKDGKEDEFRERLNFWERYYIELYDTVNNGYNITNGGDSNFSEGVIEEMRRRSKELWNNLSDEEKAKHKERSLKYWNDLSDEEKAKHKERSLKYWNGLSEEEKEKYKLYGIEGGKKSKELWNNLSDEEKTKYKERSLKYWNGLSEEEKEKYKLYGIEGGKKSKELWYGLSEEEKKSIIRKSKEAYNKWRSSISDEEFYKKNVDCHRGHAIGRAIYSSKLNRGRNLSEEAKKHLSELNKGKKQSGYKVRKYSECGGTLLEEFESLVDAAKSIGINIDSLYGRDNFSSDGFYFEIERRKEPKGYSWKKRLSRWNASICYNGKDYDLGCFKHEEAAHEMYLIARGKIENGTFLDWELNNKFDEKMKLYEKYGEKMRNLV